MYRTTLRSASRPVIASLRSSTLRAAPRRFASTAAPADKSRTWKSSVARLGLAAAAVYYYNTSPVFAEEAASQKIAAPAAFSDDDLPTVDSVLEEKRKQIKKQSPEKKPAESPEPETGAQSTVAADGSPAALEEEAGQQGAFNPETGEINWDCPCLGGMAHGPCGEEFKTAFSCFVFSTEEPKGMDCIDKFQGMQECFKKYPEIYGAELADDEDGAPTPDFGDEQPAPDAQKTSAEPIAQSTQTPPPQEAQKESPKAQSEAAPVEKKPEVEKKQEEPKVEVPRKTLDSEPLQSHDATAANAEIKILEQEAAQKKIELKK
ncbi:Mitochondrial intermembrane space import and assembly protein 40 [Fusarium falciforme]|uniref:Mitochondrial intermembrane space import and assembly protein 40 n=1 Tax=Fusarium falciforme TaxID=195108 RepID=UPI002300A587|nr:Mitochondrial intermembrane space import and assembly protein 40 [Fusarium falciforme]WAO90685.1 Mitochondrial intermembrane space import and assembly protein 40 [Fusarium falciforme]